LSSQYRRKVVLAGIMAAMLLISFLITLHFIGNGATPLATDELSDVDRLARRDIYDRGDLIQAAVAAGLHSSDQIRGALDEITRINEREVAIKGWLVDPSGAGDPLTAIVFAGGHRRTAVETKGERADVAQKLRLVPGAEKNVGFHMTAVCRKDEPMVIVGIGREKQYLYLTTTRCP
jgi:hypothetical protein